MLIAPDDRPCRHPAPQWRIPEILQFVEAILAADDWDHVRFVLDCLEHGALTIEEATTALRASNARH